MDGPRMLGVVLQCRMAGRSFSSLALVPQSSIEAEGFRSLREGEAVEFELEAGEDGRTKAVKVTGPEGAAPQVRRLTASWSV